MREIDRLGWAAGFCVRAHGVRLGVRATDAAVLDRVRERLPWGWQPTPAAAVDRLFSIVVGGAGARPGVRRLHLLYGNAERLARTSDGEELLRILETDAESYVASAARRRTFVHAGVVAWRGRAILLPGASHSGKSMLVAALLRAGARYYSDEFALLDERGRAHPYARPLALREPGLPVPAVGALPSGPGGRAPLPLGLVALLRYRPGRALRVRRLSPGQAVLRLLAHSVPARLRPEAVLGVLQRSLAGARVVEGVRGEAEPAAELLLRALEEEAPGAVDARSAGGR